MKIDITSFGEISEGKHASLITLRNKNGMSIGVSDLGATLVSVVVPDKDGHFSDVVLGYNNAGEYRAGEYFFGATVGRNANRISGAKFELNGTVYTLYANDGENNLHSMPDGYHMRIWDFLIDEAAQSVKFSILSPHMDQGFPGEFAVSVTYALSDKNELIIKYHGVCDRDTVINMTNHSYFNLAGHGAGDILAHNFEINANAYTPIDGGCIPTGEIRPVADSPFDFRISKPIGKDICSPDEQLDFGRGYDHNFVLNCDVNRHSALHMCATVLESLSGRMMEVFSDLPGIQLYSGNFLPDGVGGKDGAVYNNRSGFCLETQYFPDAVNKPGFPSPILYAGKDYHSTTVYQFSVTQ